MDNQLKALFGAWIQAIGTVIAAVGSTPSEKLSSEFREHLSLWGNELQAVGNALIADSEETFTLSKLGNEIQAIGNVTVMAGIIIDLQEETKLRLDITGNWLQAFGGTVALPDDLVDEPSTIRTLNISGNILQIIGNSLQAINGTEELKNKEKEKYEGYRQSNEANEEEEGYSLDFYGSWIQAVGSVISAIAQTKESL
jgi:hypothetical protein